MYDLVIKNGTIVSSNDTFVGNICVKDGRIATITECKEEIQAEMIYDAAGKHVFSGFIDTHVHSRDGGATHKEDFAHSTVAAACGGITTLLEMPNAVPAVVSRESFLQQRQNLSTKAYIDYGMWALSVGDLNNDKMPELDAEGVCGFKFFWGYAIRKDNYNLVYSPKSTDTNVIPPLTDGEVLRIFQKVAETGKELAIHAENASIIKELTKDINPADYKNAYEALLAQRPILAEVATSQLAIEFARATGARLHILHVTAAQVVDLIRRAQKEGVKVTAETCPHYLLLTNERFDQVGNMMKGYPPVRYKADQEAIWEGLYDGTINHICSDHAPHTREEKLGELADAPAGMCGVESMVPLMVDAVSEGKLTVNQLAAWLSENPARHYNLYPKKGSLLCGTDADITVIDFDKTDIINADKLHSISKVTAFDGFMVKGLPVATFLRGHLIAKDGEPVSDRYHGQYLSCN